MKDNKFDLDQIVYIVLEDGGVIKTKVIAILKYPKHDYRYVLSGLGDNTYYEEQYLTLHPNDPNAFTPMPYR